jgi:hypothetical protein
MDQEITKIGEHYKAEGKRIAESRALEIIQQVLERDRFQSSDNLRRTMAALSIHSYKNTMEEWTRYFEAKIILAARAKRLKKYRAEVARVEAANKKLFDDVMRNGI